MKHLIIGGVAGGATAAARIRRISETDEIILLKKEVIFRMPTADCLIILEGPYPIVTNCLCRLLKLSAKDSI